MGSERVEGLCREGRYMWVVRGWRDCVEKGGLCGEWKGGGTV